MKSLTFPSPTTPLPISPWTAPLYRVHRTEHGPLFFGRSRKCRFDDPLADFGVLYAAENLDGGYLETIRLEAHPGRPAPIGPTERWLFARGWSVLRPVRPLRLVDLVAHQQVLRVPGEVMAGTDYTLSQAWARHFFEHPEEVDGILYRARHDLKIAAVALFERPGPGPAISVSETTLFQDDLDATLDLLDRCHHLPVADEVD